MLVLSRRKGEAIIVAGSIAIRVVDIQNGTVRIGVDAPRDITIDREEVHERKLKGPKAVDKSSI